MIDTLSPQQLFFEQIEQEVQQNPILHLLYRYFRNRQETIYQMKEANPSDAMLLDFISNAFGISGGGSLTPEGWYEYAGGKHPRIEIQDSQFKTTHKLEGKHLVSAFRQVYCIHGDQLSLF